MADSISIFGVRTGDEGVRRDLHIASSLGDGTDLFVAISMVRVVRVDDAAVDVIEQGFKGARRHTIAGKDAQRLRLIERFALATEMILELWYGQGRSEERRVGKECRSRW